MEHTDILTGGEVEVLVIDPTMAVERVDIPFGRINSD